MNFILKRETIFIITHLIPVLRVTYFHVSHIHINEPAHEIMALLVLRKLILQTRMCSHPVELDLIFGRTLCLLPYFMCANSEGSGSPM